MKNQGFEELPPPNKLHIWALTDGRPGNDNQTIAVAEKTGPFEIKRISFNKWAGLPNFLLGRSTIGINTKLQAPFPDIVIGAGRKLARVARVIKKRSPKTKIIQLMWPGWGYKDFDLLLVPKHDGLAKHNQKLENLVETDGSPNRITSNLLADEANNWKERIPPSDKPAVAVLVGKLSLAEADRLINILNKLEAYPLITTSRRTPAEVIENFKNKLNGERYLYEWKPDSQNPYLAFLGMAEYIISTGDSLSMVAESITTGKPVYIFECEAPQKHRNFIAQLYNSGHARKLEDRALLEKFSYIPFNCLENVAEVIKNRFTG